MAIYWETMELNGFVNAVEKIRASGRSRPWNLSFIDLNGLCGHRYTIDAQFD
jgi:hypothetical protein